MIDGKTVLTLIGYVIVVAMSFTFAQNNYRFYQVRVGKEKQVLAWNVIIYSLLFVYFMIKAVVTIVGG